MREDNRQQLRRQLGQRRSALTKDYASQASINLLENVKQVITGNTTPTLTIAGYRAIGGELSMQSCFDWMHNAGICTCLPIVSGETLQFAPFGRDSHFESGKFGIETPQHKASDVRKGKTIDIVFVPLVGFDLSGNRLGMGGGFYDKTFAFRQATSFDKSTQKFIGIAYECQKLEAVPYEPWDVPLDLVITESAVYPTPTSAGQ